MSTWRGGNRAAVVAIAAGAAVAITVSWLAVGRLRTVDAYGRRSVPAVDTRLMAGAQSPTCAAPARSGSSPALAGIAFYASSLGNGLPFEGDYAGRLTWDGSGLEVDLPLALVRRESVGGAPTYVAGIALALAKDAATPEGWRIVRQGPLHLATGATHRGADTWMRNVHLRLDGLEEEDLEGRRLVIVQQLDVEDATGSHPAWTYTAADRDLLPRLMGGILGGC